MKKNFLVVITFIDGTNNKIYISSPILKEIAIAILALGIKVPCIGNTNREMLASTYTVMRINAYNIAVGAGLDSRTPYERPDYEFGYFHYHSSRRVIVNGEEHNPHSFYHK